MKDRVDLERWDFKVAKNMAELPLVSSMQDGVGLVPQRGGVEDVRECTSLYERMSGLYARTHFCVEQQ